MFTIILKFQLHKYQSIVEQTERDKNNRRQAILKWWLTELFTYTFRKQKRKALIAWIVRVSRIFGQCQAIVGVQAYKKYKDGCKYKA